MDSIWCGDGISLSDLTLLKPQNVSVDAWSRRKQQPVFLSIRLALASPFATAAATDSLDASTLHYGHLAKALSSLPASQEWESLDSLAHRLANAIPRGAVQTTTLTLTLPKGSLLGDSVKYTVALSDGKSQQTLQLERLNLPVLVGLNPHERTRRQPLLLSIWLIDIPAAMSDAATELETLVEQAVRDTAYETLESLILDLVAAIETGFVMHKASAATIRVRVEKPMAVGWAAAPAVEVVRGPHERLSGNRANTQTGSKGLRIYRPYA